MKKTRMKMIPKPASSFFTLLVIILSMSSLMSCTALASSPTPTTTPTNTATTIPTITPTPTAAVTATPKPSPTATNTPTDLELLDERTQFLFGEPASRVIDFFLEIQDCVRTDNKEKLASLIRYPITIHSIDRKDVEIKNSKEFIANYKKIATPKWKSVILAQEPAKLFTNWKGVMVNRGELWFNLICFETCPEMNYYIVSIINDTPW